MGPEAKLEAKFCNAIKKEGGKAYKFTSPSNMGVTDRIILIPKGPVVFVEIKDGNKKLTPLQLDFQKTIIGMDHCHEIIRFENDISVFINKYFWNV